MDVRALAKSIALALTIVALAALAFVGGAHLVVGRVADRVVVELDAVPPRSVVIVPGAGLTPDGRPMGFLTERLTCAEALFRAGRVQHILVSGDGSTVDHDEPNAMRRWLVARGVPESKIQMDYAGFRTRDTMQRAARVFLVKDAVICTQGLHANRTGFLALDAGLDAVVARAHGDTWFTAGDWLRERGATAMAVFDALVGTEPRMLGPTIPIASLARQGAR